MYRSSIGDRCRCPPPNPTCFPPTNVVFAENVVFGFTLRPAITYNELVGKRSMKNKRFLAKLCLVMNW